ncbi:hypothetical protein DACRYDRAFT_19360 [Dacryopinax primogenitus]|uniref:Uncharacterized protein n=1 Tax=Dacryopinax primogenitus (strain DJM 731) TaxID=1858805 RepID=M5GGT2_DACPD|nr:uncharacterized protein DACRYDRAFT_19360 [Dacryopinax primogenitus]EJU06033.1 hypothetical protein DACRYDRAFT_19360 [Dacryopinax primogenitus]
MGLDIGKRRRLSTDAAQILERAVLQRPRDDRVCPLDLFDDAQRHANLEPYDSYLRDGDDGCGGYSIIRYVSAAVVEQQQVCSGTPSTCGSIRLTSVLIVSSAWLILSQ